MRTIQKGVIGLVAASLLLCGSSARAAVTPEEAKTIATEAYIFLYPLVTMDVTRRVMTNVPPGAKAGAGPIDTWQHFRTYPPAEFREVVRPNFDTLYSIGWLDLTKEPRVITIPDSGGRYYVMPFYDMWTDAYAAPGSRTNGTGKHVFAIVPPGWTGTLPAGVDRIDSPTPINWVITRTQTNGAADYATVNKFQDGFEMVPLSQYGKPPAAAPAFKADPSVDMKTAPLNQVNSMPGDKFFAYAAELMTMHKPHATDFGIVERMKRIGITPGQSFDAAKADPAVRQAIMDAPATAQKMMQALVPRMARVTNGWMINSDTMGVYGNYYLTRATISMIGLGANQAEDAAYPLAVSDADGKPIDGNSNYVMHFDKDKLPPVDAFWSITMYDKEGFQVANPLNRFAIGDRDQLKYNADGSLDIYIQNASPGTDKESNWLPAPKGPLGITMRLYAPHMEVLNGTWVPPGIKKVP
jgi:hypothetical protein